MPNQSSLQCHLDSKLLLFNIDEFCAKISVDNKELGNIFLTLDFRESFASIVGTFLTAIKIAVVLKDINVSIIKTHLFNVSEQITNFKTTVLNNNDQMCQLHDIVKTIENVPRIENMAIVEKILSQDFDDCAIIDFCRIYADSDTKMLQHPFKEFWLHYLRMNPNELHEKLLIIYKKIFEDHRKALLDKCSGETKIQTLFSDCIENLKNANHLCMMPEDILFIECQQILIDTHIDGSPQRNILNKIILQLVRQYIEFVKKFTNFNLRYRHFLFHDKLLRILLFKRFVDLTGKILMISGRPIDELLTVTEHNFKEISLYECHAEKCLSHKSIGIQYQIISKLLREHANGMHYSTVIDWHDLPRHNSLLWLLTNTLNALRPNREPDYVIAFIGCYGEVVNELSCFFLNLFRTNAYNCMAFEDDIYKSIDICVQLIEIAQFERNSEHFHIFRKQIKAFEKCAEYSHGNDFVDTKHLLKFKHILWNCQFYWKLKMKVSKLYKYFPLKLFQNEMENVHALIWKILDREDISKPMDISAEMDNLLDVIAESNCNIWYVKNNYSCDNGLLKMVDNDLPNKKKSYIVKDYAEFRKYIQLNNMEKPIHYHIKMLTEFARIVNDVMSVELGHKADTLHTRRTGVACTLLKRMQHSMVAFMTALPNEPDFEISYENIMKPFRMICEGAIEMIRREVRK